MNVVRYYPQLATGKSVVTNGKEHLPQESFELYDDGATRRIHIGLKQRVAGLAVVACLLSHTTPSVQDRIPRGRQKSSSDESSDGCDGSTRHLQAVHVQFF